MGAFIFTCFFGVNESKNIVTTASKIHGAASAIGFMLLLPVPLCLSSLSFQAGDTTTGIIAIISFVLALICFTLFIMADKPKFQNTVVAKEGLWQRLNLLFLYLPLACIAMKAAAFQTQAMCRKNRFIHIKEGTRQAGYCLAGALFYMAWPYRSFSHFNCCRFLKSQLQQMY